MSADSTLFKKVDYDINKLLADIDVGDIGLPDIQRPFVWKPSKVRDLFDSMYRGFPVGYLLFWENYERKDTRQIGTDRKQKPPRLLIVDGQQRLTSLYAVLRGKPVLDDDYNEKQISIGFKPAEKDFKVTDAAIRKDPEWIPDISELWKVASKTGFAIDFVKRLRKNRVVSEAEEGELFNAIDRLHDLHKYPFTALELSSTVDEEQIADVFVRINSQGKALNMADFILTLMSVFWEDGRKELEKFCKDAKKPSTDKPSPFNQFIEPEPSELLKVSVALGFRRARMKYAYLLLRGKDLETEKFSDEQRDSQFQILEDSQGYVLDIQNWHEFFKALVFAGYRSKKMITSDTTLVYNYAMFLIGKRDFKVGHAELRNIIARWFVMTSMTGRYTKSYESALESDLGSLNNAEGSSGFVEILDGIIKREMTDDFWSITLPQTLQSSSFGSPSQFAYYAMLNVLDAPVLFSEMKMPDLFDPLTHPKKSNLEEHHLFPKDYLRSVGIADDSRINQIANRALVEWPDNLDISNLPPREYLPKFAGRFTGRMQELNALPDDWEHMEYEKFLDVRRHLMAGVTRKGFETLSEGQR